jgi:chemotaxis protein MotB
VAASLNRSHRPIDIWPGFVDALATLVMAVVFLLMVFVVAQFSLSEALSGRDAALRSLQQQANSLADLLALERKASASLEADLARLTQAFETTVAENKELSALVETQRLAAAADAETRAAREQEAQRLRQDVATLTALKQQLEAEVERLAGSGKETATALAEERTLSERARAEVLLLNQQLAALQRQISTLNAALEASEAKAREQGAQITALGQRLNAALAGKVQELARYRSEFFGRLREILGEQPDIRIVGDRFVFQSEVLFGSGATTVEAAGRQQLAKVAVTLKEIARQIPADLNWVLQIEGHTDDVPIQTAAFPSNWELSTARALAVVRILIEQGLPSERLLAAGFGEYHPLDRGEGETARRRNRRIELKLTQR